ncbi:dihydrodipicolinate synthase family protein [Phytoactinopolyspora alkaliphila]|uniref:Dihydrodipicolinate synthase family protein n=1 Tax=Phytoactinopolyspora alkaliphila TaxID=1783498 RepID=A0A6N9YFQ4_9ACTN|nr:dihydrodipicolinate synthase family protein [Phytoactinopolyspora alkaliphila]NED93757.1 dihydrodipicolinate synthase family protein [Phytoactinopolyspora alkaliphila]
MSTGREMLSGVTVPLVTPMDAPGRPSADAATALLAAVHSAGADALMLLGSNGEGPLLPTSVLRDFTAGAVATWRQLGGDRPVLVNITAAGTADVLARAETVLPARPEALVLSPPIYFHHRDDEIIAHYAACAGLGVPVVAYNAPKYSNPLTDAVFDALLDMEHVIGVKDSSGDLRVLRTMVDTARERRPGFGVGQGAEGALVAGLRAGADGIVPGIANIAPAPAVELYRAWCAERPPEPAAARPAGEDSAHHASRAEHWQAIVDQLCGVHRIRPGVPTVKEILSWQGLCPVHVAPPLLPCTDDERRELRAYLEPLAEHLLSATA